MMRLLIAQSTFTPSPHCWQMNASIREKPGNRFTAPQCGHSALATSRVASISSSVR